MSSEEVMRKRAVTKRRCRDSSITKTAYFDLCTIWYCAFFNPAALYNFGLYECSRVKHYYTSNSFRI